jgi:hypothetical protein
VPVDRSTPAEQRLYNAVARWNPDTGYDMPDLIDAARQALIDGLDSSTLRERVGASVMAAAGAVPLTGPGKGICLPNNCSTSGDLHAIRRG